LPSSILTRCFPLDLGGSFTEDAPRPPVPGEEGELVSTDPRPVSHGFYSGKSDVVRNETSTATPRRSDLDLGYEPEGSASPTPPYLKWAESLHSLLDDQDGINLFRTFLKQEDCADLLDFWFACSGFRKLEPCLYLKVVTGGCRGVLARSSLDVGWRQRARWAAQGRGQPSCSPRPLSKLPFQVGRSPPQRKVHARLR
uniref:RGS domain-containing protein n=1 Tax=Athene cunicularia TaxID=194338 RepID=A0A663N3D9_ATHCN